MPHIDDDDEYVIVEGQRNILARLEFEGESDELSERSVETLVDIMPIFSDGVLRRYEIHGHFCAGVGGGRRVATQRTEAVVEYLILQGISEANILSVVNASTERTTARRGCAVDRLVDIMTVELRRVRRSDVAANEIIVEEVVADEIIIPITPVAPITSITPTTPVTPTPTAAQGRVTVAVYMAGDEPSAIRGMHGILAGELVRAISASEKFIAVDRTDIILEQLAREHEYQRSGAVDDDQIRALGRQLGVQYLCISTVVSVGNGFYVDTRLVDVVTARVIRAVTATSNLRDATEAMRVARETAHELIETEHANRCGRGEETAYNPAYQFCFGGRAYNLCGGGGFNPLTQGCIAGQEVGTKCADGSVVSLGTHCGRHALSTNVAPSNGGSVIRTPNAQVYSADASVALSAVAARGFEFAGWAGAQTSSETSINIRMTRDMPFVAMFRPLNNNTLITSAFPANGGTITRVPESDIYESGETVTVTAIPARGFEFAGWEGASSSTSRTVNIMIDEGKTLVAIFKPNLHTLNAYATPDIGGSVFINGTALMAAASSDEFGNMIEAFAQPATGYVFAGWSGDVSGTSNPIMVDISNSNRTVIANFTPQVQRGTHDTRIVAVSRNESVQHFAAPSEMTTQTSPEEHFVWEEYEAGFAAGLRMRRHDHYFSVKYLPPITGETMNGWTTNIEYGQTRGEGWFWGIDFSLGTFSNDGYDYNDRNGYHHTVTVGGGVSFGNTYEFANDIQLAVGGSVGLWAAFWSRRDIDDYEYEERQNVGLGGPFVKLRWRFLEMSYRGLIGYGWRYDDYYHDYNRDVGVAYISQLMLGYHFQTSRRVRMNDAAISRAAIATGGGIFTGEEYKAGFVAGLRARRHDHYFSVKYLPPITGETMNGRSINLEYGQIRGEGRFRGFDLGGGTNADGRNFTLGMSFNTGYTYELANDMQLAIGGSAGIWGAVWDRRDEPEQVNIGFGGPLVKLRWRYLEVSYRGLIGYRDYGPDDGIGYISQLMAGYHFQTSRRVRR